MYYALVTTLSLLISLWVSLYCQSLLVADSAKRGPQISFDFMLLCKQVPHYCFMRGLVHVYVT